MRQEACLFTQPIKGMSQSLVSNRYDPLLEERELFNINKGSTWVIAVARMKRGDVPCSIRDMTRQGGFRTQEAGPPDQARRSFKFWVPETNRLSKYSFRSKRSFSFFLHESSSLSNLLLISAFGVKKNAFPTDR